MGKKSRLKAVKRIAATLTPLVIGRAIGEKLPGKELIAAGTLTTKTGGTETMIQAGVTYKRIAVKNMPVNHARNLKKLFMKHGQAAVDAYTRKVAEVVAKSKQKQNAEPINQD